MDLRGLLKISLKVYLCLKTTDAYVNQSCLAVEPDLNCLPLGTCLSSAQHLNAEPVSVE